MLDGTVVDLHLFGIKLFQPRVLFDVVVNEAYRLFPLDLHGRFALFPVVEPCLGPPSDPCSVGIDRDRPWYVETLYVDVQFRQRVDDPAIGQGFVIEFFFTSPPIVERYTSCRKAR